MTTIIRVPERRQADFLVWGVIEWTHKPTNILFYFSKSRKPWNYYLATFFITFFPILGINVFLKKLSANYINNLRELIKLFDFLLLLHIKKMYETSVPASSKKK